METKDPALLGLVADRIEAPAELTRALAGAPRSLARVRRRRRRRARRWSCSHELAQAKKGRATIIAALAATRGRAQPRTCSRGDGVIGPLVDRSRFAPEDEALVATRSSATRSSVEDAERRARALASRRRSNARRARRHGRPRRRPGQRRLGRRGRAELVDEQREMRELARRVRRL